MKSVDEQLALIRRGVDQIVPEAELRQKLERSLKTGRPLRVKYGIDPTGIDVHLGHTVPLRKLRLFQELGHQAVLIIGNYTALVGDPSGRDQTRARLTPEQVETNARDYLKQVSKVIDIAKTEVTHNGDWFSKMRFLDVLALTTKITMQRVLERDDFTKRRQAGTPIYLHECLYPLMQGQDSVEIRADVEVGGSEQLFSLMVGRDLQRDAGQEPQVCITLPLLRGLDGQQKMGKSLGNYIGVGEPAYDMFAKVMSIPDDLMREWFELLTDRTADEVSAVIAANPMQAKKTLGQDIVRFYYGERPALEAAEEWKRRFSEDQDPTEILEVPIPRGELEYVGEGSAGSAGGSAEVEITSNTKQEYVAGGKVGSAGGSAEAEGTSEIRQGKIWICKLLVRVRLAKSNKEARRHIEAGAVTIGPSRQKITDPTAKIPVPNGLIVRVGKRNVVRVRIKNE